jgi:hypothetical protein
MRWTWKSVVAALLFAAAIPAGATVTVDATNATPGAAASAEYGASLWQSALSSRGGCLGAASITFGHLSGRKGEYNTRTGVVTIDPDVSPEEVVSVAIHELAHHAHLRCGAYANQEFTRAFYLAQGLPADRAWFDYSAGWSATPAEIFAEAVTMVVTNSTAHGVAVTAEARAVVEAWMHGSALPAPATTIAPTTIAPNTIAPTTTAGSSMPPTTGPAEMIPRIPTGNESTARFSTLTTTPAPEPPRAVAVIHKGDCGDGCIFVGDFQAD